MGRRAKGKGQTDPSTRGTRLHGTRPKAVIFDMDGTLIDSVDGHARAWQDVFARYGYEVEFDRVRSQIGKGGDQLMPVFLPADLIESTRRADREGARRAIQEQVPAPGPRLPRRPRAVPAGQGRGDEGGPGVVGQAGRAEGLQGDRRDRRPGRRRDQLRRRRTLEAPPRYLPRRPRRSSTASRPTRPWPWATPPTTPRPPARPGSARSASSAAASPRPTFARPAAWRSTETRPTSWRTSSGSPLAKGGS